MLQVCVCVFVLTKLLTYLLTQTTNAATKSIMDRHAHRPINSCLTWKKLRRVDVKALASSSKTMKKVDELSTKIRVIYLQQ